LFEIFIQLMSLLFIVLNLSKNSQFKNMEEPFLLKNLYNAPFFENFAKIIGTVDASVKPKDFINKIFDKNWEEKSLKERMRHATETLHEFLPANFKKATPLLKKICKIIKQQNDGKELEYLFIPDYVALYGIDHYEESINLLAVITPLSSAEFGVRPFIVKYPKKMMAQMLLWADHKNEHIRRLASEGCRPLLPWGKKLNALNEQPKPILPILKKLKNDPSEYVRRSVANNLNDLSKNHPDLVLKIAKEWMGKTSETDKLVKHALRTLLKKGDTTAMRIFGFGDPASVLINNLNITPDGISIGDSAQFSFDLILKDKSPKLLRLEYIIGFLKANGSHSKKVFQIKEGEFQAHKNYRIDKKQHFKNLTTRKHYPGPHFLTIKVNGIEKQTVAFSLSLGV